MNYDANGDFATVHEEEKGLLVEVPFEIEDFNGIIIHFGADNVGAILHLAVSDDMLDASGPSHITEKRERGANALHYCWKSRWYEVQLTFHYRLEGGKL